jgi:hypothetical protein
MDPNSRYIVATSRMNERIAEAQRARLVKGDDAFGPEAAASTEVHASTSIWTAIPSRLRTLLGHRAAGTASV